MTAAQRKQKRRNLDLLFGASAAEIHALGIDQHMEFDDDHAGSRAGGGRKKQRRGDNTASSSSSSSSLLPGVATRGPSRHHQEMARRCGEANLKYLNGDLDAAIGVLLEVIRQAPEYSPAFQTLGVIYEELGQPQKALDIYLVAAHITPKDREQWRRLAQMAAAVHNREQGVYCLTKACGRMSLIMAPTIANVSNCCVFSLLFESSIINVLTALQQMRENAV
jgi:tetratricopeptide (TPR) repeat protein